MAENTERLGLLLPSREQEKKLAIKLQDLEVSVVYAEDWEELLEGFRAEALSIAIIHGDRIDQPFSKLNEAMEIRSTIFLILVAPDLSAKKSLRWIHNGGYAVIPSLSDHSSIIRKLLPILTLLGNRDFLLQTHQSLSRKLREKSNRLAEEANRDELTGFMTAEQFEKTTRDIAIKHQTTREPVSLIYAEIDQFEQYNEFHGSVAGNEAVSTIADFIAEETREQDRIGRLDQDLFGILLPRFDQHSAYELAENLRQRVNNHPFQTDSESDPSVSLNIGISALPQHATHADELHSLSRRALRQSQQRERNYTTRTVNHEFRFRPSPPDTIESVSVVGNFNDWNRDEDPLEPRDDEFVGEVPVPEGPIEYAFCLDGDSLVPDSEAEETRERDDGTTVSKIEIRNPSS